MISWIALVYMACPQPSYLRDYQKDHLKCQQWYFACVEDKELHFKTRSHRTASGETRLKNITNNDRSNMVRHCTNERRL